MSAVIFVASSRDPGLRETTVEEWEGEYLPGNRADDEFADVPFCDPEPESWGTDAGFAEAVDDEYREHLVG